MRDGSVDLADEYAPALDPGDEPGSLDGERDEDHPDPGQQHRQAGRDQGDDGREGERTDEQPDDDRAVGVPGGRVDRREQERPKRRTSDPRSSEARSTGDAGRGEPGQDQQQPCHQDDCLDHVPVKSVDSTGSFVSRRIAPTTSRAPMPTMNAGHEVAPRVLPRGQERVEEREAAEQDQRDPEERHDSTRPLAASGVTVAFGRVGKSGGFHVGQGFDRHDDRHDEVQQEAEAADEDRHEPEQPHDRRVGVEVLGHAGRDTGQTSVMTATIETAIHLHPPIGSIWTLPKSIWTSASSQ